MRDTEPIPTLTQEEADKVHAIVVALCGEEFASAIEEVARENAMETGFSVDSYARHRALAPVVVDLIFAFDPEFTQAGSWVALKNARLAKRH